MDQQFDPPPRPRAKIPAGDLDRLIKIHEEWVDLSERHVCRRCQSAWATGSAQGTALPRRQDRGDPFGSSELRSPNFARPCDPE